MFILTLIFAALNNEPMNDDEVIWWWAFLGSLLITSSFSGTALVVIFISDYKNSTQPDLAQQDMDKSRDVIKSPTAPENSGSYKTIMTIDSTLPEQTIKMNQIAAQQESAITKAAPQMSNIVEQSNNNSELTDRNFDVQKFVNLTPPLKNPVTVIDIPSMNAKKRAQMNNNKLNEPVNLGAIPSSNITGKRDLKKKKKLNKEKDKRNKDKKKSAII